MKKILIVDDFEFFLTSAELILKDTYEVYTAQSGQEAVEQLEQGLDPHLILLDVVMPDMDGWVTFNRIKDICSSKKIPIAFVTNLQGNSNIQHAMDMGAADFIMKPYNKSDLLARIAKIIT